jgi:hypothetical protein
MFVRVFRQGLPAEMPAEAFETTFRRYVTSSEPESGLFEIEVPDGGTAVLYTDVEDEPMASVMISRFSPGQVLDLAIEFARRADAVLLPAGCPVLIVTEAKRADLPEALRESALVVASGADIESVFASLPSGVQSRNRRRQIWITVVAILAVMFGLAVACTPDERAYSIDSGDMSLEEGLELFAIVMPDCPVRDLHYALVGLWGGHDIYLRFTASAACMQSFVALNGMADGGDALAPASTFQSSAQLEEVHWTFADRNYHTYSARHRDGGRAIEAVIGTTGDLQVLSLYGFPV